MMNRDIALTSPRCYIMELSDMIHGAHVLLHLHPDSEREPGNFEMET